MYTNIKKKLTMDSTIEKLPYYGRKYSTKWFKQNFKNWTSGNNDIDRFIQTTQLHNEISDALEWIPYDRFYDIRYIAEGEFEVCKANWIDGNTSYWDYYNQTWKKNKPNIVLKILNNPASITSEFIKKV
jgi:hypothetical protein